MTFKTVIIATILWTLLVVAMAVAAFAYIANNPVPGVTKKARADQMGKGIGILGGIGYGVLWLPYAARVGAERRAAKERSRTKKKSPGKRRRQVPDDR